MALQIARPKSKEAETEELPAEEEVEGADVVVEEDEVTRLKLENAEQRGRLSVLQGTNAAPNQHQQIKTQAYADANNLSDEDFLAKYKQSKSLVVATILERENTMTQEETKRLNAESRAEASLSARYGPDFYRFRDQIDETLVDLSTEARLDPKRLEKHMERQLKAFLVAKPKAPKSVNDDGSRRKVVTDFERTTPEPENKEKVEVPDEIVEADRGLAAAMGLHSEKERKEFMGDFVPMDMGGGIIYKDPSKGFEKLERKAS